MAAAPKYTDVLYLPPPPRAADFHAGGRGFRRMLWGPLLIVSCIVLGLAAWGWWHAYTIDAGARTATARVLGKEERPGGEADVSHYVRFSFRTAAGDEVEAETWARPEQYDSVSVGQELPVHYLPESPAKDNWLLGYEETRKLAYRDALTYVWSLIGPVLIIALIDWAVRRERGLARRGEFALGRITEAGTNARGKGAEHFWISFECPSPSGETVRGWTEVSKEYFEAKGRAGEAVGVLYDPRRPRRCQALPGLQFVGFPPAG